MFYRLGGRSPCHWKGFVTFPFLGPFSFICLQKVPRRLTAAIALNGCTVRSMDSFQTLKDCTRRSDERMDEEAKAGTHLRSWLVKPFEIRTVQRPIKTKNLMTPAGTCQEAPGEPPAPLFYPSYLNGCGCGDFWMPKKRNYTRETVQAGELP
ncbi:hypothetical protein BCR34DRAFT_567879 [Clohesyomyces aquaticus]|uniref:Uncharacterized protein n=1 Tax=Clohesyomyces aquaticus TaxID=1231657 RepID=A0A1Y1ZI88_9PLEO|nr:hypothetical protein BCR34DRAFT_567879 [Clohesyomyces aquaticus]